MAQAARDYSYYRNAAPQRKSRSDQRPSVHVIPGTRQANPALQSLPPTAVKVFKAGVAIFAIVAVVFIARVMFTAATVQALQANSDRAAALEHVQATGNELEIQRSILASPDRIKKKAKALGMTSAKSVTYLTVDYSMSVAVNPDGTVSLAGTLANIENAAAAKAK